MNFDSALQILPELKKAAVESGIYPNWFLSFGTTLGRCREYLQTGGEVPLIPHDSDMDIGILSDRLSPQQEENYFECVDAAGLFKERRRVARRKDNGRLLWFSLRKTVGGCKCCNWFMFSTRGHTWHTKGDLWVNDRKFSFRQYRYNTNYDAVAKGIPTRIFSRLVEVDIRGEKYNVPLLAGSALDCWYPGWAMPKKGGTSDRHHLLLIQKWENPKPWRIV